MFSFHIRLFIYLNILGFTAHTLADLSPENYIPMQLNYKHSDIVMLFAVCFFFYE